MKIKFNPSKYRIGDKVYLVYQGGGCLVTILDVYKHNGKWFYDVDASSYMKGFELSWVIETALSKYPSGTKDSTPIARKKMKELEDLFNQIY